MASWLPMAAKVFTSLVAVLVLALFVFVGLGSPPQLDVVPTAMSDPSPTVHGLKDGSVPVELRSHATEITVSGIASRSTIHVSVNEIPAAAVYQSADGPFTIPHVAVPTSGTNRVSVDASMWHGVRLASTAVRYTVANPSPTPAAILFAAEPKAGTNDVELIGAAAPRDAILVYDSARARTGATPAPDATIVARLRAESDGRFAQTIALPTGSHHLWAATLGCAEKRCSQGAKRGEITITHAEPPPAAFATRRAITFRVSYERMAIDVAAVVPRGDPVVAQLTQGADGKSIIGALYGTLSVNQFPVASLFANAVPSFSVALDRVTIHLRSTRPIPPDVLPAFSGRVMLAQEPAHDTRTRWSADSVTVVTSGCRFRDPIPTPDEGSADGAVTWDHPFAENGGRIGMTLQFSPWGSLGGARSFLGLSVFSLVPGAVARYLSFMTGFVYALPMLAYLLLARDAPAWLRVAARWGTAVCVAPQVFLALTFAASDVAREFPVESWGAVVISAAAFVAVSQSVVVVAQRFAPNPWAAVVCEAAYGVGIAALTFACVVLLGAIIDPRYDARHGVGFAYVVFVTLSIAIVPLVLSSRTGLYRRAAGGTNRWLVVVVALIVLLEAAPFAYSAFVASSTLPELDNTPLGRPTYPALIYDFLRQASVLADFTFGLALISTNLRGEDRSLTPQALMRIVLCCYAVDATTTLLLVPVTFVLAWLTFPLLLARTPPSAQRQQEVRAGRRELVLGLLYGRTSEELTAELQEITDQNALGKLGDAEFAKQRQKLCDLIEQRITLVRDVFGVGPNGTRQDAKIAMAVGAAFALAHLWLFFASETAVLRVTDTAFPVVVVSSFIATGLAQFVAPAFVFGACYTLLRGRSGLQKGLYVAAWAILCSLPSWWVRLPNAGSVLVVAVETALFYTVLGVAFDLVIARIGAGVRFSLRDLPRLSGIPALSWAGSIVIASLGVAIGGAVTHQFEGIVTSTISTVYRQAAPGP